LADAFFELLSPSCLHALQHRGQEAGGIVSIDPRRFQSAARFGYVRDTLPRKKSWKNDFAGGTLVVYRLSCATLPRATKARQRSVTLPTVLGDSLWACAIAHNGNITTPTPARELIERGRSFSPRRIANVSSPDWRARFNKHPERRRRPAPCRGAFSVVWLTAPTLIAPCAIHWVCCGLAVSVGSSVGWVALALENCSLDIYCVRMFRFENRNRSEDVVITPKVSKAHFPFRRVASRFCYL